VRVNFLEKFGKLIVFGEILNFFIHFLYLVTVVFNNFSGSLWNFLYLIQICL
jgi:hypothetical protein